MSKSVGNVVAPEKVIKQYGAEILRLWVATQDYRNDTRVGDAILKQVSEAYRRIRNTARYILGNIHDFDPSADSVADANLLEIDRWALSRLENLVKRVRKAYDAYEFHVLYHAVHNFCAVDMSAFYLDVLKDRLYTAKAHSSERRSAQTAIYRILDALTRLMAPVLSFTAEEIWSYLPGEREESVHLASFPDFEASLIDTALEAKYERLLDLRSDVAKVLETARNAKQIGHSLDAKVFLCVPAGELRELLDQQAGQLAALFIVSQVELVDELTVGVAGENFQELRVAVSKADGTKCGRCWNYATSVGSDSSQPEICHRCLAALA